jgi:hypothetical protein
VGKTEKTVFCVSWPDQLIPSRGWQSDTYVDGRFHFHTVPLSPDPRPDPGESPSNLPWLSVPASPIKLFPLICYSYRIKI